MSDSYEILKNSDDPEIIKGLDELAEKAKAKKSTSSEEKEIEKFDKRRKSILAISFITAIILSYLSFNYLNYMFGFALGLAVTSFSLLAFEWLDEIYFRPYTIGKLAENSIALAIFFIGLIYLFTTSLEFGDRWIGGQSTNSIEEDRIEQPVKQPEYPTADSTSPPVRIELRGGNRETPVKQ